jgi:hypothetical protein
MRFTLSWAYYDSTIKLSNYSPPGKAGWEGGRVVAWRLEMRAGTAATTSIVGSVKV